MEETCIVCRRPLADVDRDADYPEVHAECAAERARDLRAEAEDLATDAAIDRWIAAKHGVEL